MFKSGASTNVIPLAMMKRLGLQVSRPYMNVCAMDVGHNGHIERGGESV